MNAFHRHRPNDDQVHNGDQVHSVRIRTGARLHFGLLDTVAPFGGIGVMTEDPATEIDVSPDQRLSCEPSWRSRVEPIARRVAARLGRPEPLPCRVTIRTTPPRHSGFGSGTQFSLAVAEAMCHCAGDRPDREALARNLAGRGSRSAVGIHGFFSGGLIHEAADGASPINPVRQRVELPESWRVGLFLPHHTEQRVSGELECDHFARVAPAPPKRRAELERQLDEQLLPAAQDADFDRFAAAVTTYNRLSGELFTAVQGGAYHGRQVAALVDWLIERGATGVGQSSWGPGVFAWFPSAEAAEQFVTELPAGPFDASLTAVRNQPRELKLSDVAPAAQDQDAKDPRTPAKG